MYILQLLCGVCTLLLVDLHYIPIDVCRVQSDYENNYIRMWIYMCTYLQMKTQYTDNVTVHGCILQCCRSSPYACTYTYMYAAFYWTHIPTYSCTCVQSCTYNIIHMYMWAVLYCTLRVKEWKVLDMFVVS